MNVGKYTIHGWYGITPKPALMGFWRDSLPIIWPEETCFIRDSSVIFCLPSLPTKILPSQEEPHGSGRGVWQEFLGNKPRGCDLKGEYSTRKLTSLKEMIPIENHHFQVPCYSLRECKNTVKPCNPPKKTVCSALLRSIIWFHPLEYPSAIRACLPVLSWTFQGVPNGWERVPLSNPVEFQHHPLEGAGYIYI